MKKTKNVTPIKTGISIKILFKMYLCIKFLLFLIFFVFLLAVVLKTIIFNRAISMPEYKIPYFYLNNKKSVEYIEEIIKIFTLY